MEDGWTFIPYKTEKREQLHPSHHRHPQGTCLHLGVRRALPHPPVLIFIFVWLDSRCAPPCLCRVKKLRAAVPLTLRRCLSKTFRVCVFVLPSNQACEQLLSRPAVSHSNLESALKAVQPCKLKNCITLNKAFRIRAVIQSEFNPS